MKPKFNLLIVDDFKLVCDSLAALAEKTGLVEKIFTAYSAEEAISITKAKHIQMAFVDVRMPEVSGIELIRFLKKEYPSLKSVAMTSFDEVDTLKEMLALKTAGILLKRSTNGIEITKCIQCLIMGGKYYSAEVNARLLELDPFNNTPIVFSKREKEIIQLISEGNSSKEIAGKLKLSISTVEDYRKEILNKIGAKNAAELIALIHKNGLT